MAGSAGETGGQPWTEGCCKLSLTLCRRFVGRNSLLISSIVADKSRFVGGIVGSRLERMESARTLLGTFDWPSAMGTSSDWKKDGGSVKSTLCIFPADLGRILTARGPGVGGVVGADLGTYGSCSLEGE